MTETIGRKTDNIAGKMNEYLRNMNKIEFVVTTACTGRCRHCQNGDPVNISEHIDTEVAVRSVKRDNH